MSINFSQTGRVDKRAQANTLSRVAGDMAATAKAKLTSVDVTTLDPEQRNQLVTEVRTLLDQAASLQKQAASLADGL